MILQVELNEEMAAELEAVRKESNCFSLAQVATEFVESGLAERRMEHAVVTGRCGARIAIDLEGSYEVMR